MKKFLLPLFVLLMVSCSTLKVKTNYDKSVNFKEFKTFSMYPWDKHNDSLVNPVDKETIITSIENEMKRRGYEYVEKGGDLIVSTFVILENKTTYSAYTNHYGGYAGFGGGWGYYGPSWAYGYSWGPTGFYGETTISAVDYLQGTIIIDIFELPSKKLVWQGIGSGEVNQNPSVRDRKLPNRISHIFRKFPVPKGK